MLGSQQLVVIRQAPGERVNGVFVPGNECRLAVTGSIQPLTGRELMLLPEGERAREQRKLYVQPPFELRTVIADGETMPDQVVYRGQRWEVHADTSYDQPTGFGSGLEHSRYRLVAVQQDEVER